MSKQCKSCGKYYNGDYCDKCGYGKKDIKSKEAMKYHKSTTPAKFRTKEQKAEAAKWEKERAESKQMKRHKDPNANVKFLIIVAVVAVFAVLGVLYSNGIIFSSKKEEVIKNYFSAIEKGDFDKFVSCFPKEIKNEYETQREEAGYSKEECMNEVLYGDFKETYGDDYTIEVELGKQTKLEKNDYDMTDYKEAYGSSPSISEAYEIVTNVTFKGSKSSEDAKLYIYVGKCSGSWKIFNITQDNGIIDESTGMVQEENTNE